ncbi:hexosyltransferase, partial [Trypanosoma cruzi]
DRNQIENMHRAASYDTFISSSMLSTASVRRREATSQRFATELGGCRASISTQAIRLAPFPSRHSTRAAPHGQDSHPSANHTEWPSKHATNNFVASSLDMTPPLLLTSPHECCLERQQGRSLCSPSAATAEQAQDQFVMSTQ